MKLTKRGEAVAIVLLALTSIAILLSILLALVVIVEGMANEYARTPHEVCHITEVGNHEVCQMTTP